MKQLAGILLLVGFMLQSQGCGILPAQDQNLERKIDGWVAKQQYAKALTALDNISKYNPKYQSLQAKRIEVEKAANAYEQQQLKLIQTDIESEQWANAAQKFEQIKHNLPENASTQAAYEDFVNKRTAYITQLNCQLIINKAQWLVKDTDVQQDLAQAMPDDTATQRALADHHKAAEKSFQELSVCGINAIKDDNLEMAIQSLRLADELQPSEALKSSITELQTKLDAQQQRTTLIISHRGKNLLNQAQKKLQEGNLKEAIALYNQIPADDKQYTQVRSFKKELDSRIKSNVSQGIELGRKLYSQGEIKQALAVWNKVRELDEDNQYLISYIKRAERVLKKLDKLQREGTTIKPPAPKEPNG